VMTHRLTKRILATAGLAVAGAAVLLTTEAPAQAAVGCPTHEMFQSHGMRFQGESCSGWLNLKVYRNGVQLNSVQSSVGVVSWTDQCVEFKSADWQAVWTDKGGHTAFDEGTFPC
jgi:hypothetical protein